MSSPEEEANRKFYRSARGATFSLIAGIREIKMLADRSYVIGNRNRSRPEQCTLLKLIDKGLVYYDIVGDLVLSKNGELLCEMLKTTGHIVTLSPDEDPVLPVVEDEDPIEYFGPGYD